ncbi:hypothetical protein IV203_016941 [Nitzschia inconspicua]|uniref:Uncharacterized protein n=1 Tax=Nitzschia inconspicua TaxID=303405 RepID=A0A9K3PIR7_9STRA|nr:hypothetical protein IV203_016941 [Nitzschia inconspicua]
MKVASLIVAFTAPFTSAFQAALPVDRASIMPSTKLGMNGSSQKNRNPMEDLLRRLTNNFEPFHGHGSLENDLDEQWEAQQELLRNRRSNHLDKSHLKQKYSDPSKVKFDGKVGDSTTSQFGKDLNP